MLAANANQILYSMNFAAKCDIDLKTERNIFEGEFKALLYYKGQMSWICKKVYFGGFDSLETLCGRSMLLELIVLNPCSLKSNII